MSSFHLETLLAADPDRCFELSLSIDAHERSMGRSGERAVGPLTSGVLRLGDEVTWRARHFGILFTMTSAITALERPVRFVDEQQRGPFALWRHEHTFTDAGDGQTLMRDRVDYHAPLGLLGTAVERLVLDRYLPRLLARRNAWLQSTLED